MRWTLITLCGCLILLGLLAFQVSSVTAGQNRIILLVELAGVFGLVFVTLIENLQVATPSRPSKLQDPTNASVDQLCIYLKARAQTDAIQAVHQALGGQS